MSYVDSITPSPDTSQKNLKLKRAPIFYLSRMLAIFPFNQNHRQLKLKYLLLLYSCLLLVTFAVYFSAYVRRICNTEHSNTNILLYIGYGFINTILCAVSVVTPIVKRNSVVSILEGFSKADAVIKNIEPEFKFGENSKRQNIQISFTLAVTFLFFFLYMKASEENVFPSFTYFEFYILPVTWLIIFQMDYLLVHMRERFAFVNFQLENVLRENDLPKKNDSHLLALNVSYLNKVNHVHFTLYEISSEINSAYSIQLLIMIPRVIFFCVLPVHYNIVTSLVNDPNESQSPQAWTHAFTLGQIVLLIAPVIYIVNVASNTLSQAKKINLLIHDLIDGDQEEQVEYELLLISIQLLHRKIEYSVQEFFSLRPSLVTAIFELIITYVIILLQFQDTLASISPVRLLLRPLHQIHPQLQNANSKTTAIVPILLENVTQFTTSLLYSTTNEYTNDYTNLTTFM